MTKVKTLKLTNPLSVVERVEVDATLGGLGLDWERTPVGLCGAGLLEWEHLAQTFVGQPVRFREADRTAVGAYCSATEMAVRAAQALREHGLLVEGRSAVDAGRPVRSPAWAMWRDASTQLRQWGNELGLSPSARSRMKLLDDMPAAESNPFLPSA